MVCINRVLALSTLVTLGAATLLAQRGVGVGVPHGFAPSPGPTTLRGISPGGRPIATPRNFPAPLGLRSPLAGYTGIRPGALRSPRNYRAVPFTYFLAPYYYPFLDYASAPYGGGPYAGPYDVGDDSNVQGSLMAESALGEQVQRLTAEVEQMKSGLQSQAEPQSQDSPPPQAPITVVLRSGEQFQAQNYAVMNQTFWDFTNQQTRRIPLSTIDIPASARATEATGGEFPQISSTP